MSDTAQIISGLTIIAGVLAACGPMALSIASGNGMSIALSAILVIGSAIAAIAGGTIFLQILGCVLYLAALTSASVIYAGSRIEAKTEDAAKRIVAEIEYLNNCVTTPAQPAQE